MSYEWLKYTSPLIGVAIGVFISPYLENKKSKKESKHAIDCFYAELRDYFEDSSEYVKNFHDCYMKAKKARMGLIKGDKDLFPINFCPEITFSTIDNLVEKSFLDLTKEQRKAVKALNLLAGTINELLSSLAELKFNTAKDFIDAQSKFYAATHVCSVFYYLLSRLTTESNRFVYSNDTADEISRKAMDSLGVSFEDTVFQ